jgi:uncharacterized coiled-coil protein SlyX
MKTPPSTDPPSQKNPFLPFLKIIVNGLISLLIVRPDELYGKGHVSDNLKEHSPPVAVIITVANLLNAGTAFPLLFLTVKGMPYGLGLLLSTATNFGLVIFANKCGAIAAVNLHNKKVWSRIGLSGVIAINTIQSLIAGISIEVILNQDKLAQFQAKQRVEERITLLEEKKHNRLKEMTVSIDEARSEYQKLQSKLDHLTPNTPEYRAVFQDMQGSYKDSQLPLDQRSYYGSPINQYPWKPQLQALTQERDEEQEAIQQDIEAISSEMVILGAVRYLKEKEPNIYAQEFDDEGLIRSEVEQFSVALQVFFDKLLSGQWTQLGLSLYILMLSVITSGVAVCMMAAYARHDDVAISWSEAVQFQTKTLPDDDPKKDEAVRNAFEQEKQGQWPQLKASLESALGDIQTGCQTLKDLLTKKKSDINEAWEMALKPVIQGSTYLLALSQSLIKHNAKLLRNPSWVEQRIHNVTYIHDYLQESRKVPSRSVAAHLTTSYLEELSTEAEHLTKYLAHEAERYQQRYQRLPFDIFYGHFS